MNNNNNNKLIDTLIVPSCEITFNDWFLQQQCWKGALIAQDKLNLLTYCVLYRKRPISAITHVAKIKSIQLSTEKIAKNRYDVFFESEPIELAKAIILPTDKDLAKGLAPQSTRYTTYEKLLSAETLADLFK